MTSNVVSIDRVKAMLHKGAKITFENSADYRGPLMNKPAEVVLVRGGSVLVNQVKEGRNEGGYSINLKREDTIWFYDEGTKQLTQASMTGRSNNIYRLDWFDDSMYNLAD